MCVHLLMIEYSIHEFCKHVGNEVEYPLGVMMRFVLQNGLTPLDIASHHGHYETVKSLIEAGANVNHTAKVV